MVICPVKTLSITNDNVKPCYPAAGPDVKWPSARQ
jgi:hypothetical protein